MKSIRLIQSYIQSFNSMIIFQVEIFLRQLYISLFLFSGNKQTQHQAGGFQFPAAFFFFFLIHETTVFSVVYQIKNGLHSPPPRHNMDEQELSYFLEFKLKDCSDFLSVPSIPVSVNQENRNHVMFFKKRRFNRAD